LIPIPQRNPGGRLQPATTLAAAPHTLTIEVTGQGNAAATGSLNLVDAFDIQSRFEDTDPRSRIPAADSRTTRSLEAAQHAVDRIRSHARDVQRKHDGYGGRPERDRTRRPQARAPLFALQRQIPVCAPGREAARWHTSDAFSRRNMIDPACTAPPHGRFGIRRRNRSHDARGSTTRAGDGTAVERRAAPGSGRVGIQLPEYVIVGSVSSKRD